MSARIPAGNVADVDAALGKAEVLLSRLAKRLAAHAWEDLAEGREACDLLTEAATYVQLAAAGIMAIAQEYPCAPATYLH